MMEGTVSHASAGEPWGLPLLNCPWSLQRPLEVPRCLAAPWVQRSVLHQPGGQRS